MISNWSIFLRIIEFQNSDFWKLLRPPLIQFSKFYNFLWGCWFLGKNLSNFVPPVWKLHNPYCHTVHGSYGMEEGKLFAQSKHAVCKFYFEWAQSSIQRGFNKICQLNGIGFFDIHYPEISYLQSPILSLVFLNSIPACSVKMEYEPEINIFVLNMIMKSGLGKIVLKFLHAQSLFWKIFFTS